MKKGLLSIFILFVLLVITACSTTYTSQSSSSKKEVESSKNHQVKPVSINQLKDLDITTYFSKDVGFVKTFDMVSADKTKKGEYEERLVAPFTDGNRNYIIETYIQEYPKETDERLTTSYFYELTQDQFKKVFSRSNLDGEKKYDSILISKNENHWHNTDNTTHLITAINKTIKTTLQTFKNCIEVTEFDGGEKTVTAYAPNMGMVSQEIYTPEGKLFMKLDLKKITGSSIPSSNVPNDDAGSPESFENKVNLISGQKQSHLKLNDYTDAVNKLSFSNLEYYVLWRPISQEKDGNVIYSYSNLTPENLYIVTDKSSFIKQISWESTKLVDEEILFNIQPLILGLDKNITMEEVNEFILNDSTNKDFGEFSVEFIKRNNGFTFNVVAK